MEEFLSEHKGLVSAALSLLAAILIAYIIYLVWMVKGDTRFDLFFFVNADRQTALFILVVGPIAAIFSIIAAWFLIKLAYNLAHSGAMHFCPPNASDVVSWLVIIAAIVPLMGQAKAIKTFALTAKAQTNLLMNITKNNDAAITGNNGHEKGLFFEAANDALSHLPQEPIEPPPPHPADQNQNVGVISFTPGD